MHNQSYALKRVIHAVGIIIMQGVCKHFLFTIGDTLVQILVTGQGFIS